MIPKTPKILLPLLPLFIWVAALAGGATPCEPVQTGGRPMRKILLVDQHKVTNYTEKGKCFKHLFDNEPGATIANCVWLLRRVGPYKLLDSILLNTENAEKDGQYPCDENGNKLPQLMVDFLTGQRDSQEILTIIKKFSQQLRHHPLKKKVLPYLAECMFNPNMIAATRSFDGAMVDLLRDAKKLGFEIYMFSNADCESQAIIEQQNPQHFQLSDGTPLYDGKFISGEIGLAKPDPAFYHYALEKIGADPERDFICLIDDQRENTKTAADIGIYGYQWTDNNYKKLEHYLAAQQQAHQAQYA